MTYGETYELIEMLYSVGKELQALAAETQASVVNQKNYGAEINEAVGTLRLSSIAIEAYAAIHKQMKADGYFKGVYVDQQIDPKELLQTYMDKMEKYGVPSHTAPGLARYIVDRTPPGDFLRAVLSNDLKMAFGKADGTNQRYLFHIVNFLYNAAPMACWGSPEKYQDWIVSHLVVGQCAYCFAINRHEPNCPRPRKGARTDA